MAASTVLSLLLLLFALSITLSLATTFEIINRCAYTVWAAAIPGGGLRLDSGQAWTLNVNPSTTGGRIWARTGCSFDGSGRGSCQTGDCGGLLECQADGSPPATLAEFTLGQFDNKDFFDISLVDGFNVPLDFGPAGGSCQGISCAASDITARCPAELRAPGGCNGPCDVFKTGEYCCTGANASARSCRPTDYSKFFKSRCPQAYSYPNDDASSTFTCRSGTDYRVVFCPSGGASPEGLPTRFGRVVVNLVIPGV